LDREDATVHKEQGYLCEGDSSHVDTLKGQKTLTNANELITIEHCGVYSKSVMYHYRAFSSCNLALKHR
jgi:hypothetical protein